MSEHKLVVLDSTGDTVHHFNPADALSVDKVREVFDGFLERGYLGYRTEGPGKAEQVREFDPGNEETVLTPPLVGG